MRLADVVDVSLGVGSTRGRTEKVGHLAAVLRRLDEREAGVVAAWLSGGPAQDRLGVGPATLDAIRPPAAPGAALGVLEVHEALEALAAVTGPGSKAARARILARLLSRATEREQAWLRALLARNLRQGALEGLLLDALARALDVDAAAVRRAAMLAGDLGVVAAATLREGAGALDRFRLRVGTPLSPMLAAPAEAPEAAMAGGGEAFLVGWKLDGARIQVHRSGRDVAVFTRNRNDVTARVPEIVEGALALDADAFILDGEALVLGPDGTPLAFQDSMRRFGSEAGEGQPLAPFYFDLLHRDGEDGIDRPLARRRASLEDLLAPALVVPSLATRDPDDGRRFYDEAVGAAYEGVVVKQLDAPYEAGRRGGAWRKVKPVHTLDLVVLAAEWGSGRRRGRLSNLHLGARDPEQGGYAMLGKTFKGLTDERLAWQTERFLELERGRRGHVVLLEPRVVYEIAFDGVQRSTRYPAGMALRFARVKGRRPDKRPEEADTVHAVRRILERRAPR